MEHPNKNEQNLTYELSHKFIKKINQKNVVDWELFSDEISRDF